MIRALFLAAAMMTTVAPLQAQEATPFEINMQRVQWMGPKNCVPVGGTLLVPTFYLYVQARSMAWASNGGASTKARVFIEGLDKTQLQAMARSAYDDLITKLRASGYRVLTYDDVRSDAASFDRAKPNAKFDMPTEAPRMVPGADFVIAAPSDEQAFAGGIDGPLRAFDKMAADRGAGVIVPEIVYTLPQLQPGKNGGLTWREASVKMGPAMKLFWAGQFGETPKRGWCNIYVQTHDVRLASENVGSLQERGEDNFSVAEWSRTKGDYAFVVDQSALRVGVLRVAYAFNTLIATPRGK